MLIYRRTSILESSAQTLVNTVNCVGVMGKGIAKAFKEREPAMFKAYKSICERKLLEPGKLWLWQGSNSWVLNFPTKIHWRNPSKIEWIEAGLQKFVAEHVARGITEVSFPRLGCGNGNLDWEDVKPLMAQYLGELEIPIYIHDYDVDLGKPEHQGSNSLAEQANGAEAFTFDDFLAAIRQATEFMRTNLIELGTNMPFKARMNFSNSLTVETGQGECLIESEDLRGAWLALLGGLVTKDMLEGSVGHAGNAFLSLLALIPRARAVEIESLSKEREFAVELRAAGVRSAPVPEDGEQAELEWA